MKEFKFVNTKKIEEKYGVSRQTVSIWRLKGLPCKALSERVYVYDPEEVHQWLVNRKSKLVD